MRGPIAKMQPVEKIDGRKSLNLDGDVQVTSAENDQLHPAIVTSSDGSMLVLYENYVSFFDGDIFAASSIDGQTWSFAGGFNIPDLRETYPAIDIINGREAIGTWVPDPNDGTSGGMSYYGYFGDIMDNTTWHAGGVDWGSYGFIYYQSCAAAGYGLQDKPTTYFNGVWFWTCDNEYSGYEEDHSIIFSYNTNDEGYDNSYFGMVSVMIYITFPQI